MPSSILFTQRRIYLTPPKCVVVMCNQRAVVFVFTQQHCSKCRTLTPVVVVVVMVWRHLRHLRYMSTVAWDPVNATSAEDQSTNCEVNGVCNGYDEATLVVAPLPGVGYGASTAPFELHDTTHSQTAMALC